MTIAEDLLGLIERAHAALELPAVRSIHVATDAEELANSTKFGALVLEDGTVGLTYVDLDNALPELKTHLSGCGFTGRPPIDIARLYAGRAGWQHSLGMAAVNAVSQYVLRRSGLALADSGSTLDLLQPEHGDHVGMVGYFPPLVEQIRARGVALTVLELDPAWLQRSDGFEVTLDPGRLEECNQVLCTGTTLINHSLDEVLTHCRRAVRVCVIGPTAGCLPDPLFERGVTAIAGCQVADSDKFIELWSTQQRWRGATRRYVIHRHGYPGFEALLRRTASGLTGNDP